MSIASTIAGAVGGIVKPITGIFTKKEETKQIAKQAEAKLALAKANGEEKIELTDAEWESLSVKANESSWKDEYLTIIITSPIVGLLIGGIWFAFTGDDRLLEGVNKGITALKDTGVDLGDLMYAVVLAGVGLKVWRAK